MKNVPFRAIFSVWICFHVLVIVLMANSGSYPGRAWASVLYPYAGMLGLNTAWNFFSPDPAHTMYLKFTVHFEDEDGHPTQEPKEIFLPESKDRGEGSISKRRELYAMRFMLLNPRRIDAVLGPWLCRQHEGASQVHVEFVINAIPSLDEAVLFSGQRVGDMGRQYEFIDYDYPCSRMQDEVVL